MIRLLIQLLLAFTLVIAGVAVSGNKPCSGKKGGVSHCAAGKHVCRDGSISASKKMCSAGNSERQNFIEPKTTRAQGACPCSSGRMCTGPRGGRYCLTPSGNKSYQRRD